MTSIEHTEGYYLLLVKLKNIKIKLFFKILNSRYTFDT